MSLLGRAVEVLLRALCFAPVVALMFGVSPAMALSESIASGTPDSPVDFADPCVLHDNAALLPLLTPSNHSKEEAEVALDRSTRIIGTCPQDADGRHILRVHMLTLDAPVTIATNVITVHLMPTEAIASLPTKERIVNVSSSANAAFESDGACLMTVEGEGHRLDDLMVVHNHLGPALCVGGRNHVIENMRFSTPGIGILIMANGNTFANNTIAAIPDGVLRLAFQYTQSNLFCAHDRNNYPIAAAPAEDACISGLRWGANMAAPISGMIAPMNSETLGPIVEGAGNQIPASTASVRGKAPSGFAGGGGRREPPVIDGGGGTRVILEDVPEIAPEPMAPIVPEPEMPLGGTDTPSSEGTARASADADGAQAPNLTMGCTLIRF